MSQEGEQEYKGVTMRQANVKAFRRETEKQIDSINRHKRQVCREILKDICTYELKYRIMTAFNIVFKRYK